MKEVEKRRAARLRAAHRRLGTTSPICAHCPEDDPFCLEKHELGGRKHSDLYSIECRNCHRKLEEDRQDHLPSIWTPPDILESMSRAAQGEADFFERLAKKRRTDAQILHELSAKAAIKPEEK